MSNLWKMVQEEKNQKPYAKNAEAYFGPCQKYLDSRHILQNPKVPRNVMGFNNCSQTFTP